MCIRDRYRGEGKRIGQSLIINDHNERKIHLIFLSAVHITYATAIATWFSYRHAFVGLYFVYGADIASKVRYKKPHHAFVLHASRCTDHAWEYELEKEGPFPTMYASAPYSSPYLSLIHIFPRRPASPVRAARMPSSPRN